MPGTPTPEDFNLVSAPAMGMPTGANAPAGLPGRLSLPRLVVGLPVSNDPQKTLADHREILAYLRTAFALDVIGVAGRDYTSVVDAMAQRAVDVAFLTPVAYALAYRDAGADPILHGETSDGRNIVQQTHLLVPASSTARTPADLRGRTVAVVDGDPLLGHWVVQAQLLDKGQLTEGTDYTVKAFGTHIDSYSAVADMRADAGAILVEVFRAAIAIGTADAAKVRVLDTSPNIPSNLLAVRNDISPADRELLTLAFLTLNNQPPMAPVLRTFLLSPPDGTGQFGPGTVKLRRTDDSAYAEVRSALDRIGLDVREAAYKTVPDNARSANPYNVPVMMPMTATAQPTTVAVTATARPPSPPTASVAMSAPPSLALPGGFVTATAADTVSGVNVPTQLMRRLGLRRLVVALMPSEDPSRMLADNADLLAYLRAVLGVEVIGAANRSGTAILDAFRNRQLDLALMSNYAYVLARANANGVPLIQGEGPDGRIATRNALLISRADSTFGGPRDLARTMLGFVETDPIVGRVLPTYQLMERGGLMSGRDYRVTSIGTHADAYQAVLDGVVDAAAVASDVYAAGMDARTFDGAAIKILDTSPPIAGGAVVIRNDIAAADADLLALAFLTINDQQRSSPLFTSVVQPGPRGKGTFGLTTSKLRRGDDASYNELRTAVMRTNFNLQTLLR